MQTLQSANEVLHEGNQYQLFKLNVVSLQLHSEINSSGLSRSM